MMRITQTLTTASVAANTTAEQTFTVTGLAAGTEVWVTKPSITNNLVIAGARVSALNTLAINFANNSSATITPPSEVYTISYATVEAPAAGSSIVQAVQRNNAELALFNVGMIT